uniref:Uncharacterized protein LOC111114878 n=1 Tax=Crassostrea virginica TaxID=6565 RepID=A0A8B8C1Y5_CRAVI|nr:uncharacterized protein LOC111114878 [Crassostrea virginica]
MATAGRIRVKLEEEFQDTKKKLRRTMERHEDITVKPCQQNHAISVWTKEENMERKSTFLRSLVDFEFGPPVLNLYQYVAEESHLLWSEARELFLLSSSSEPKKGLFLFHDNETDLRELCWEHFEFDPHSTSFSAEEGHLDSHTEVVCVFVVGELFWKNSQANALLEIENQTRFLNKSHVFFITDTDEAKDQAVKFTKKTKCCYLTHVFQVASDKTPLYDAMYEILQRQLDNFLSDLHSRASTGLVRDLTPKLEPFLEKLRSRKKRHQSSLTKQCVSKIKSGKELGIVGHRLCGNVLYVYEDNKMSTDPQKKADLRKCIEENFNGVVCYKSISDVFSPHCALRWGGPLGNGITGRMGTLGIFGTLRDTIEGPSQSENNIIALSSGHLIHENVAAFLSVNDRIGMCIWPANSSDNILDVSVVKLDQNVIDRIQTVILNEKITVGDIPKSHLLDQPVFKYGATTGRTDGRINIVDDFQLFDEDVMTILPRRPQSNEFSTNGDSGAIVLTRYRGKLHGVGVIYGGCLTLPNCQNIREETIAVFLRRAMDRFTNATQQTIELDRI